MELSDEERELSSAAGDNRPSDRDGDIRSDEAKEEPYAGGKEYPDHDDDDDRDERESKRRVDPSTSKKRIVKNPQPKLDLERIRGPKGVQTIEKYFEGFEYRGKGHEKNDLDRVMKRLEHWAHRLFPKYRFDDFIEKIELLGTKKNVGVFLKNYRLDMTTDDRDAVRDESEGGPEAIEKYPVDEFDKLISEQIEKQRASEETVRVDVAPGARVSDSAGEIPSVELSDEIKARIETNKKLALERKTARIERLREEKEKRASRRETPFDSPTITAESRVPEFSSRETVRESESEKNKRQKLENSREFCQIEFPDSRAANFQEDTDVREHNRTENLESDSVPNSKEFSDEIEETRTRDFPRVRETRETPVTEEDTGSIESSPVIANRSETLLTRQQLLMAIDGAMEEIIGRKN